MNLEELKSFIQSELNYTKFTQEGNTLEIVFKRSVGEYIVSLTLIGGVVQVVEIYESKDYVTALSKSTQNLSHLSVCRISCCYSTEVE